MSQRFKREKSLNTRNICNALSKVNSRWEEIGNELNIPPATISNIDRNKRGNVNMCTLGLTDHWLRTDVKATWEKLAQALETLEENNAAADIRGKYIPDSFTDSISASNSGSGSGSGPSSSSQGPRIVLDGSGPVAVSPNGGNDVRHIHVLIGNNQEEDKLQKLVILYSEDSDVELDSVDQHGCSFIHHCAKLGDLDAMKALIALGANINMMDSHQLTPYDAACYVGKDKIADFLKEVGGCEGRTLMCMEQSPQSKRPRRSLEEEEQRLRVTDDRLILSLDSSSTMAVLQLEYLSQLEKATGRTVTELFSWIVASGVGGFLMLAMLYCDFGLDKLRRLYFRLRERVFCGLEQKRRGGALKDLAVEVFEHKKMNSVEARVKLLIGAVNKESTALQPKFFTNFDPSPEEATRSVWEVACYTCSTPHYIGEKDQYVDGGSICKNPSIFALGAIMEQCRTYGASIGGVVSLGDGQYPAMALKELDGSNFDFFTRSTTTALTKEVSEACSKLCYTMGQSYYRFDPLLTSKEYAYQPEEMSLQKLVDALLHTITQCQNDEDLKKFGREFS